MSLINKKEYFSKIAETVSTASKDPSTKVGAVIVDNQNRIVSTGYNGFVAGCNESKMTFERPMKYHLTIHAEMNAILFAKRDLRDCRIYVTHGPCENCLKHIIQAGIKTVFYKDAGVMKDRGSRESIEAIRLLIESSDVVVKNIITGLDYINEIIPKKEIPEIIPKED